MKIITNLILNLVTLHAHNRKFLSSQLATLCRNYLMQYYNAGSSFSENGEENLLRRIHTEDIYVIFDVGANIGDWSNLVLKYLANSEIHAFEASPVTAQKFNANVTFLNSNSRLNIVGLADQNCFLDLNYDENHHDMSTFTEGFDKFPGTSLQRVKLITGDEYCKENKIKKIDLLKIDVEGFELKVLNGFKSMISNQAIDIIQLEHNRFAIFEGIYLKHYYDLLSENYFLGPLLPKGILFQDWSQEIEEYRYGNIIAISKKIKHKYNLSVD